MRTITVHIAENVADELLGHQAAREQATRQRITTWNPYDAFMLRFISAICAGGNRSMAIGLTPEEEQRQAAEETRC